MTRCMMTLIIAALCAGTYLTARAAGNIPHRVSTETALTMPNPAKLDTLIFSPDGKRLAFIQEKDGKDNVVLDGVAGKAYDTIRAPWELTGNGALTTTRPGVFFSPDSKHAAFAAIVDSHWVMVLDGQPGAPYDEVEMPVFSADSAHLAYKARSGDNWCVVVDGQPGKAYAGIGASEGVMGERNAPPLLISPVGGHVAYAATLNAESLEAVGSTCVVLDGKEDLAYDRIYDLTFSQDGKHLAYVAEKNRMSFVVTDGQEGPSYAKVGFPVLSPNGERLAYLASADRKRYFVVADGQPGAPYENVKPVSFSPDGRHYYYVAQTDGRQCMVVDGREGAQYTQVFYPVFSPNSKHAAYMAVEGKFWCIVLDGAPGRNFDAVWTPVFSPDSAHVAYAARLNEQTTVVLDHAAGLGVNGLITNILFTPDSKHILYEARDTTGKTYPVTIAMDNHPGQRYERMLPRNGDVSHIYLDGPNQFHYFAEKNHVAYRVDERIE